MQQVVRQLRQPCVEREVVERLAYQREQCRRQQNREREKTCRNRRESSGPGPQSPRDTTQHPNQWLPHAVVPPSCTRRVPISCLGSKRIADAGLTSLQMYGFNTRASKQSISAFCDRA